MKVIVFLIMMTCCTACTDKQATGIISSHQGSSPENTMNQFTYLALGDSYTIGQSVNTEQAFPNQLRQQLNLKGFKIIPPKIIAQTGWPTDALIDAIKSTKLNPKYDIVTLLIGVNNQYRNYSKDIYRKEFAELLQTAIKYSGGKEDHVFVISIPDWSVTPFAKNSNRAQIAKEIDDFNQINKEETQKTGAIYTDITPISREAAFKTNYIATDGLHPSETMYAEWVKLLEPKVMAKLQK